LKALSKEYALFISITTLILFSIYEHILVENMLGNLIGFSILFVVIIYASLSVAHHAELLA
jgi:Ca2+:H+ antiporter